MENIIYYSLIISVLFFLCKFLEFKLQDEKDQKDIKLILKDTFVVFLASLSGIFLFDNLKKYINPSSLLINNIEPVIFTDTPGF